MWYEMTPRGVRLESWAVPTWDGSPGPFRSEPTVAPFEASYIGEDASPYVYTALVRVSLDTRAPPPIDSLLVRLNVRSPKAALVLKSPPPFCPRISPPSVRMGTVFGPLSAFQVGSAM